ncbi:MULTISPECIES: cytochrome c oxidase subunit I [Pedobacter]|uniref:Cytochrome-c oxidase n=1 Tax=Pedobacter heparinus (strain ATCC 13125 / DSM 2366 / CIP 104194 / JCM 7457 / NBRC 12017 / NCIMB 9290 / NRRL B-14731 / HIM 762-3) TaxID=485917 RepID=C6XZ38_PEDHD|nr:MULTISPECIES: cbb3-type cytochrome c oxidase subunit I [Pedobacter]ACU02520.1 Cytochrome-c oxidase [Pedobacter heparinus DSM 2366]MBB5440208.1 cytochrome c oxidase subunit 1 [Pedobacter sp. AK017]
MSTISLHDTHNHDNHDDHGHHKETFLTKYVFSQDHKMIAKQFLITGIIMAVIAMGLSILFRLQLAWPDKDFPILETFLGKWAEGGRIKPDFYLALVTIHGTIMVFFVLTAGLSGTFSNLLIPLQIGARDMASPFLNMLSYWFFFMACVIMMSSFFIQTGPASAGWTVYPPLSALPTAISGSGLGMTLWLISMVLFVASSLMGGINYVSTILNMRTKGMDLWKMPLTIWAFFLTAVLGILSFPVLVAGVVLLIFDRSFGTSFYLSDIVMGTQILPNEGGSPILWQHLFWFLGHPEVYIVIMPAMGLSSEIMSVNARKPIFGYHAMIYSLIGITILSFIVWGHHMFVTGMNPLLGGVFMITTLIIAVPSAVKTFNWLATLWRGNIRFTPAMLFAIGMVSFFISGGLTGIFLGNASLDINLHDTYFVVAHFHLVMGSAAIFGMLAGVYHYFPKMFGRMMSKKLGYLHFWITFACAYLVFFPLHFLGLDGVPRRYYAFTEFEFMHKWVTVNILVTWSAIIAALAQVAFLFNFFYSIFKGKVATQNPWGANTLEWTTPVERLHGNWPGEIPTVYRWPYDYSKPGAEEDFIPQTVPFSQTMNSNMPHDFEGNSESERIQREWEAKNTPEDAPKLD